MTYAAYAAYTALGLVVAASGLYVVVLARRRARRNADLARRLRAVPPAPLDPVTYRYDLAPRHCHTAPLTRREERRPHDSGSSPVAFDATLLDSVFVAPAPAPTWSGEGGRSGGGGATGSWDAPDPTPHDTDTSASASCDASSSSSCDPGSSDGGTCGDSTATSSAGD